MSTQRTRPRTASQTGPSPSVHDGGVTGATVVTAET